MSCNLPAAYPDELLYSVVARYVAWMGASSASVVERLFDMRGKPAADLPGSLEQVATATQHVWGLTATEIAERMTLLPFYARFVSSEKRETALSSLCSGNASSARATLGLTASIVQPPTHLRHCLKCRETDVETYGETWWRRLHQLPGVVICPEHGIKLVEAGRPLRTLGFTTLLDATNALAGIAPVEANQTKRTDGIDHLVAARCAEILAGHLHDWNPEGFPDSYSIAALERGFRGRGLLLDPDRFDQEFAEFYEGTAFERYVQVPGRPPGWWAHRATRRLKGSMHPTQHALVQIFLESIPKRRSIGLGVSRGEWKCPNPYADHSEEYPIKRITSRKIKGRIFGIAECGCGFKFSFEKTCMNDPGMPIVERRLAFGPSWTIEAQRQRSLGHSVKHIARALGIKWETASKLLRSEAIRRADISGRRPTDDQLVAWRTEWSHLLDLDPLRRRSWGKRLNQALYVRLMRWDREWLWADAPMQEKGGQSRCADWAARDATWAPQIALAVEEILRTDPPWRVTVSSVFEQAQVPISYRRSLSKLPLMSAEIEKHGESLEDFQIRRLRHVFQRLRAEGGPIPSWRLRLAASLNRKISRRLQSEIQHLASQATASI